MIFWHITSVHEYLFSLLKVFTPTAAFVLPVQYAQVLDDSI